MGNRRQGERKQVRWRRQRETEKRQGGGEEARAYMRWVLSGVQSGRYLAPSPRALSRSSERKGFWKPLSTTTTPSRTFPSSCGLARGARGAAASPRGFPDTAPWAAAGTEAGAGVRGGAGTAEARVDSVGMTGTKPPALLPQTLLPETRTPSPQPSSETRTPSPPPSSLRPTLLAPRPPP